MVIEVSLHASLRKSVANRSSGGVIAMDVPEGFALGEVLEELDIDLAIIKTMLVNGIASHPGRVLSDGDRVGLYPEDYTGRQ